MSEIGRGDVYHFQHIRKMNFTKLKSKVIKHKKTIFIKKFIK